MTIEQLEALVRGLPPAEKIKLIDILSRQLIDQSGPSTSGTAASAGLIGLCKDLGPAPSAEEIDQVRKEMFSNFPREDIP